MWVCTKFLAKDAIKLHGPPFVIQTLVIDLVTSQLNCFSALGNYTVIHEHFINFYYQLSFHGVLVIAVKHLLIKLILMATTINRVATFKPRQNSLCFP